VGHRADGSLILDTTQIKPPRWAASGQGGQESETPEYTRISPQPQEREYRDCGRCRKPAAKLKCACLATHYCDIQCQREDMPVHRQICTHMILKEINLSQSQLKQHQETHGMFTVEVAKLELLLTEMHIKFADLLRTSRNGTNQEQSEHHYIQALQRVARLVSQTFLKQRPSLLYNLRTDQVAAHLGLGCLYRDQKLDQGAMEHLEKAHDLTQELTTIEDSPGQQDRLGVILTIQGEILNESKQSTPDDRRRALEKQQMAVVIFHQLEQTTIGPLRERIFRRLVEALFSMADTLENLELHNGSQDAMREARIIGKRAQFENLTSSLHQHQQIFACTKEMMNARRDLDEHTSTLHVGSKICLHGLLNQAINGKEGTVIGSAVNNRIGIQLQGNNRQVSIRILNLRYQEGPGHNFRTLYCKVVDKAQAEI